MHHAPFSQGSHTHDDDVIALREGLAPVFSEVGVDLVLSGHDHIYTRTHLMEGTVPQKPETLPAIGDRLVPTDGQVLYVTSTTSSGSKYYNFHDQQGGERANLTRDAVAGTDSELPTTAFWAQDYTPDFSNIQISPSELTVTTHNVYSPELVDEVTISKEGTPAPTTPGATIQPVAEDPSALQAKLAQFGISQDRLLDWLKEVLVAGNGSIAVLVPYYRQILNFFGARF
ncbi:hypothetical protein QP027_08530 [Corynebacterium breve]|uniref:Calcineurin-like phosphoesterase domain-containing protein n=1 Tax=Corynebacterium breve TaxID=3049799 RepID=A0ABY8VCV9_9CORY|nr:hypothetical protein [Corynebacterium breve]WIM67167.1 hypothetical protein QP027_08530 [Corynebacterium breve]